MADNQISDGRPRFELRKVTTDGEGEIEIYSLRELPQVALSRKSFLSLSAVMAVTALAACSPIGGQGTPTHEPVVEPTSTAKPGKTATPPKAKATKTPQPEATPTARPYGLELLEPDRSTPTPRATAKPVAPPSSSSGGGSHCTCNKVCTCIPVRKYCFVMFK